MSQSDIAGDAPDVSDLGLQNERTAIAWQRTALSMMVGALMIGRLQAHAGHTWMSLIWLAAGLPGPAILFIISILRFRAGANRLRHGHVGPTLFLTLVVVGTGGCFLLIEMISRT